ncbi:lipopolysaccharide heptosyltransferase II [Pelosinus sp. sgz500959]|uniref:lipopolysaccharide heptosyltransferase II n=1 Tax=Pelosinus sp. sgz500959 TaxID=3242472 RepID=UPI003672CFFA
MIFSDKPFNKVLFYYTGDTLGDMIISTSAIALYKKKFPNAHITMMVRSNFAPILWNSLLIDDVLELDYKRLKTSWLYYIQLIRRIKNKKFDISIAMDQKAKAAILTYFAQIPKRIGYRGVSLAPSKIVSRLYNEIVNIDNVQELPVSEFFLTIIRGFLGLEVTDTGRPFVGCELTKEAEDAELRFAAITEPKRLRIGLCLAGRNKLKSWPNASTAELINRINQKYSVNFFIVGTKEDSSFVEELASLTAVPLCNFCGKTNIRELVSMLRRTDLFITVDTASMHIAAALEIPLVALFGPFSPEKWKPVSENAAILWNRTDCSPCNCMNVEKCPQHICMRDLSVEEVYRAVCSQLDKLN